MACDRGRSGEVALGGAAKSRPGQGNGRNVSCSGTGGGTPGLRVHRTIPSTPTAGIRVFGSGQSRKEWCLLPGSGSSLPYS